MPEEIKVKYTDVKEKEVTFSNEYITKEQETSMLASFTSSLIEKFLDGEEPKIKIEITKSTITK